MLRILSLAILTLVLLMTIQPHAAPGQPPGEGGPELGDGLSGPVDSPLGASGYCRVGKPWRIPHRHASDSLEVTFGVAADPQFMQLYRDGIGWQPEEKLLRQQEVALRLREVAFDTSPTFAGVVVVGDLVQDRECKELLAFRQLYEYGYSDSADVGYAGESCNFDENLFAWRHHVGRPMFPVWGNHDDPTQDESDLGDTMVLDYIRDLVYESDALYESPIEKQQDGIRADSWYDGQGDITDNGFYAWEWGSFHFISLGLWAFVDQGWDVGDDSYDEGKVGWLKEHLAAVGTEKAIVLFQHYGFDMCNENPATGCSFELKYKDKQRWWTWENAKLFLNVLCNRDSWEEPCGTPERPKYNVVGIFTGHRHASGHCHLCPEQDDGNFMTWSHNTRCGYDTWDPKEGDCDVYFDNFIVNDAGTEESAGFTKVRLNAWPKSVRPDDENAGTIDVQNWMVYDFDYDWDNWDPWSNCKYDNKTSYSYHGSAYRRFAPLTTEFLTFRQGEPNSGREENCAEILTSGRLNDRSCAWARPFACHKDGAWLVTSDEHAWDQGWSECPDGYDFGMPQTVEEQAQLMQAVIERRVEHVWVNYTDQDREGHWTFSLWDSGQPDGGTGENCAMFHGSGRLADTPCGDQRKVACFDSQAKTWHLTPGQMQWGDAWQACHDLDPAYEFGMPQSMGQKAELQRVLQGSDWHHTIWVNYTDQAEEGTWQISSDTTVELQHFWLPVVTKD